MSCKGCTVSAVAEQDAKTNALADGFGRFCDGFVRRLPFGLNRLVAPTFVGFAMIGGATFCVDLVVLWLTFKQAGLPYPLAATLGYAVSYGLAFLLNRILNFDSHGPVGQQAGLYAAAVAFNYVAFIVGLAWGLIHTGVDFRLARFAAAVCEAAFMYSVMRYLVFRRGASDGSADGQVEAAGEA